MLTNIIIFVFGMIFGTVVMAVIGNIWKNRLDNRITSLQERTEELEYYSKVLTSIHDEKKKQIYLDIQRLREVNFGFKVFIEKKRRWIREKL